LLTISAKQSSIFGPIPDSLADTAYQALLAIDNNLSQFPNNGDCASTGNSADNYWQAELADYSAVRRVTLYVRHDCCKIYFWLFVLVEFMRILGLIFDFYKQVKMGKLKETLECKTFK